jgi:hypothetical protein
MSAFNISLLQCTNLHSPSTTKVSDPSCYRGIAISSCLSKFFTKILHNRLENYLEQNDIICPEQIGFRKGARTSDHIFSLKTLIDKYFRKNKYVFVCFVDLKKAFPK